MVRKSCLSLLLLGLVVALPGQDTAFIATVVQKWRNAGQYTLEVARALPTAEFGFQPTPEEMSFGRQLEHIAQNMVWLASNHLTARKMDHPLWSKKDRSPAEILAILEAALKFAELAMAETAPAGLEEKHDFFAGPLTRRQAILLMHDHQTHHRGQLLVYLRLRGYQPPPYRGW